MCVVNQRLFLKWRDKAAFNTNDTSDGCFQLRPMFTTTLDQNRRRNFFSRRSGARFVPALSSHSTGPRQGSLDVLLQEPARANLEQNPVSPLHVTIVPQHKRATPVPLIEELRNVNADQKTCIAQPCGVKNANAGRQWDYSCESQKRLMKKPLRLSLEDTFGVVTTWRVGYLNPEGQERRWEISSALAPAG
jgi:hypothetical protein